jgi:hypothetical protein
LKKNKSNKFNYKYNKRGRKMIGWKLQISSSDLQNTHLCNKPNSKIKDSPGYELYVSIDMAFQLNDDTVRFFMTQFMLIIK